MRIGYCTTPFSATRSPKASSSGSTSPAIMPRNRLAIASASSMLEPVTASVIIDALDWLIEHPAPWNVTSATVPPSTCAKTVISSPHSGLLAWHCSSAPGSSRLFRGFL